MKFLSELWDYLKIDAVQFAVLVLGVTEVLLARANNVWLYPAGIAATALSMYALFNVKLYAESLLNLYYLVMSVYGWWYWTTKRGGIPVEITTTTQKEWVTTISIVVGGWIILYFSLVRFTDSENP